MISKYLMSFLLFHQGFSDLIFTGPSTEVMTGSTVELKCSTKGVSPLYMIVLKKDGKQIKEYRASFEWIYENDGPRRKGMKYVIPRAELKDGGNYSCKAIGHNPSLTSETSYTLNIYSKFTLNV